MESQAGCNTLQSLDLFFFLSLTRGENSVDLFVFVFDFSTSHVLPTFCLLLEIIKLHKHMTVGCLFSAAKNFPFSVGMYGARGMVDLSESIFRTPFQFVILNSLPATLL